MSLKAHNSRRTKYLLIKTAVTQQGNGRITSIFEKIEVLNYDVYQFALYNNDLSWFFVNQISLNIF